MTAAIASTRLDVERAFAIEAVATASRLCRTVREGFDPAEATAKADGSPVTVADLGAQTLVSMMLRERLPDDSLMGEEDFGPLAESAELAAAVVARVRDQRPGAGLDEVRAALSEKISN